jgi:tetratricopeptide (TPR) repeat protein
LAHFAFSKAGEAWKTTRMRCEAYVMATDASHKVGRAKLEKRRDEGGTGSTSNDPVSQRPKKQDEAKLSKQGREEYYTAANLLLEAGSLEEAFNCLWSAQKYDQAALLCVYNGRFPNALQCWAKSGNVKLSALVHAKLDRLHVALALLRPHVARGVHVAFTQALIRNHASEQRIMQNAQLKEAVASCISAAAKACGNDDNAVKECLKGLPLELQHAICVDAGLWHLITSNDDRAVAGAGGEEKSNSLLGTAALMLRQGQPLRAARCYLQLADLEQTVACVVRHADVTALNTKLLQREVFRDKGDNRNRVLTLIDVNKIIDLLWNSLRPADTDKLAYKPRFHFKLAQGARPLVSEGIRLLFSLARNYPEQAKENVGTLHAAQCHTMLAFAIKLCDLQKEASLVFELQHLRERFVSSQHKAALQRDLIRTHCDLLVSADSQSPVDAKVLWATFGLHVVPSTVLVPLKPKAVLPPRDDDAADEIRWENERREADRPPTPYNAIIAHASCALPSHLARSYGFVSTTLNTRARKLAAATTADGVGAAGIVKLDGTFFLKTEAVQELFISDPKSIIAIKGLLLCAAQRMLAWLSQLLVAPPSEAGIMENVGVFFLARDAVERLAVSPRAGFSPRHLNLLRPFLDAAREKLFAAASTAARAWPYAIVNPTRYSRPRKVEEGGEGVEVLCALVNEHAAMAVSKAVQQVGGRGWDQQTTLAMLVPTVLQECGDVLLRALSILLWVGHGQMDRVLLLRLVLAQELVEQGTAIDVQNAHTHRTYYTHKSTHQHN